LSSIIYPQNKFNLKKLYADYPFYKGIIGSDGKERRLTTSIFTQLDVFTEDSDPSVNKYRILGLIDNNRVFYCIKSKYLEKHENTLKYKVLVPKSNGSGALGEILSSPLIGNPLLGYTQSFIGIGAFETEDEAKAAINYIKTKFCRLLLGVLKVTQDNSKEVWRYVPNQDFAPSSDINWNKPIADIDKQLYTKYELTNKEISFIESMIKPMV
jgi:hypothetical protein